MILDWFCRFKQSNVHPLEVVSRGSDPQLQVGENLNYLISRFEVQRTRIVSNSGAAILITKTNAI